MQVALIRACVFLPYLLHFSTSLRNVVRIASTVHPQPSLFSSFVVHASHHKCASHPQAAMSRPISVYGIDEALSPRDREEFSIFLSYPELDFDSIDDSPSTRSSITPVPENKDEVKSSPLSAATTAYNKGSSVATKSTAHDTPSRFLLQKENAEVGGWNEFIHLMQKSDLPQECLGYFTSLGQTVLNIGTILHSTLRPNQPSSVLRIGRWLLKGIKYSSKQVASQVEAISRLKSTVAFNVSPDETQFWSTYRQRARMIAKYYITDTCEFNADYNTENSPCHRNANLGC